MPLSLITILNTLLSFKNKFYPPSGGWGLLGIYCSNEKISVKLRADNLAPDGQTPAIESNESFRKIFNLLADRPETVAKFFIPKILTNKKNGVQFTWLTNSKAAVRFLSAPFGKRKLM